LMFKVVPFYDCMAWAKRWFRPGGPCVSRTFHFYQF
jgi:hypothetical protein